MKIGILHFTDLHIKESNNWIEDKINKIISAIQLDFTNLSKVYIVISGDIVNEGKGFNKAEQLLTKLKKSLERFTLNIPIDFIITPGNHDCNFSEADQVREILINSIANTDFSKDNSVIDTCIKVQHDFWLFYGKMVDKVPLDKLAYQIKDEINNKIICFNCYNTAWMSSIRETTGKMFFPIIKIPEYITSNGNTLTISVFHHPLSWFNPNTEINNKREFEQYLERNSQILIYGHEHEDDHLKKQDISSKKETIYISGTALQNEKDNSLSGLKTIIIDVDKKDGYIKEYKWKKDLYICNNKFDFTINGAQNLDKKFKPKQDFLDKIDYLSLPLTFATRQNVKLSDIFVYPDLEKLSSKEKKIDEVYSSRKLLTEGTDIVSIEGDAQSGKTSLLYMLYLSFLDLNKYPLLIESKNLLKYDSNKTLRKVYQEQYDDDEYNTYLQYSKDNKILFIDNLQDFTNNTQSLIKILKDLQLQFGRIIIGTTTAFAFSSLLNAEFKKIDYFFIQPLGYKKRNELIEKYHILNESPQTICDQIILEKTKFHFDQIQTVLGNRLIPSYPVYILSILQTLIYATPHNLEQTSLGYCYQSLLYVALADKAKIKNEDIDSYFNFLSELAFNLYQMGKDSFSENYLQEFYVLYNRKYIAKNLTRIKETLLISNIIVEDEDGDYKFRYNYIFYFLISRRLVDLIHHDEGKKIVTDLCNNLSDEKSANILILTTHHSKDSYLIDEATFSLMVPYNSYIPITLETKDNYYKQIEEFAKEISSNLIQANRNPNEERLKALEASDRKNAQESSKKMTTEEIKKENEEQSNLIEEMVHALKAIEIVGQIVKNRKGSIDRDKLKDIVKELYNTAFRTISFFGEITKSTQKELIESFKEDINANDTSFEIENKINKFFQHMTFQYCLGIFSRIIYSVGNKDLKDIFEEVANEINTPAAKIVTFSIKSSYSKISIKELKTLANEFDKNPVALSILRARVRAYIYNNHIDYKDKQRIADTMKMKMLT